jgi:hypothetical protein
MDKLEIIQGSFIQQTQYFIPVEIDLHVVPARLILFKKQLFDPEVKGQGPKKVNTVRDTPPYGHAPTYEISFTYLERQKSYGDLDP